MKGIKKALLLALSFAMSMALFVACGGGGGTESSSSIGGGTESSSQSQGGSSSSEVVLPDTSIDVPDVDEVTGAPVADATAWTQVMQNTLSATNATIVVSYTRGTQTESAITMIANGVVYEYYSGRYNFYGEVDGQSYNWYSADGKTWEAEEIDWEVEDYATAAYSLEGIDSMLSFEDATYNAETGAYVGDNENMSWVVKIVDNKVANVVCTRKSSGEIYVYQIVYGQTADMTLPALPTPDVPSVPDLPEIPDVDGEQVDETAWAMAWANTNAATNFTAQMVETYMGEVDYGYFWAADGKSYIYGEYADGDREHIYYGTVDGKNYCWYSEDGETWEAEQFYEDITMYTTGAGIVCGLDQMLDFSDMTYEDGYYSCTLYRSTLKVKIADGYVVEISVTDSDGEYQSYKLAYGNATVGDLPELPQEEIIVGEVINDADHWAEILAYTDEQTNFTSTANGQINRTDGKIEVRIEIVMVDDGNVYVERETMIYDGAGAAMGSENCYYQGVVDGVAYQWDRYDAVEIIEEVTDGNGIVQLLGLDDLAFADAELVDEYNNTYSFVADGDAIIKLRVVDGLICYAELTTETMFVEYKVVYGETEVVLPPIGGGTTDGDETDGDQTDGGSTDGGDNTETLPLLTIDFDKTVSDKVIGEEVTSAEMTEAIAKAYASTNLVMRGHAYVGGGNTLYITHVADGKMRTLTQATYQDSTGEWCTDNLYQYAGDHPQTGVYYCWLSFDGVNWDCGPAEDVMMGSYKNGKEIFGSYLDLFLATDSTYSGGVYSIADETSGMTYSIKIVGGEVKEITIDMGDGEYMTYVIEYDGAMVGALPPVTDGGSGDQTGGGSTDGDETIPELNVPYGEEVTAEVWEEAIETLCSATNIYVSGTDTVVTSDYSGTAACMMQIADGKCYAVIHVQGYIYYYYMGNVDGKNYEWDSQDGNYWECECTGDAYTIDGRWFLEGLVSLDLLTFENLSFDEEEGGYRCQINETEYVIIGINDGMVSFLKAFYIDNETEDTEIYVLSYGDAYVGELPPVTDGGSGTTGGDQITDMPSQEEWNYAFETLLNCNNVGLIRSEGKSYSDGTGEKSQAKYLVAENAVEYILQRNGVDATFQRVVFANENGEDTQYVFSNETGIWTKAESAIMSAVDFWGSILWSLERYADIYERMDWDSDKGYFYASEFTYISGDGTKYDPVYDLCIFIDNGQVMEISYAVENSDNYANYRAQISYVFFDYNNMTVNVPTDGQVGDTGSGGNGDSAQEMTKDDLAVAFENTMQATNYTIAQVQEVEYYDEDKQILAGGCIKMTENAVWQEYVQETTVEGVTTKNTQRGVWATEDGVSTQYDYDYDTETWTQAEEAGATVERVFTQMAMTVENFCAMLDVLEWNGNEFYVSEYTFVTESGIKGNTFYDVYVAIENGYITEISYRMEYDSYGGVMTLQFGAYDETYVYVPTDGQTGDDNEFGSAGDENGEDNVVVADKVETLD